MGNPTFADQTDLTILAKLDSSKNVRLFLLDNRTALQGNDTITDRFSASNKESKVWVQVVSTDAQVTVTNHNGSDWPNGSVTSGSGTSAVTMYYAVTGFDVPSKNKESTDQFTITVGGSSVDPTVVIKRGGSGEFEISSVPRGA